ncbi:hypothetical protein J2X65_004942 [Ancylobacter sp. 3268]|uniref:Hint domain-containing protein n=1 Tax=Ancylobacter sp. 3268 TaxID=2817752 RepID=UPI002854428D|nr:Hint domain-containing protein [Ancylobacter sp. 3268]MDR6955560.1 hypothetical protein [Ancylobacter sp. 3268]
MADLNVASGATTTVNTNASYGGIFLGNGSSLIVDGASISTAYLDPGSNSLIKVTGGATFTNTGWTGGSNVTFQIDGASTVDFSIAAGGGGGIDGQKVIFTGAAAGTLRLPGDVVNLDIQGFAAGDVLHFSDDGITEFRTIDNGDGSFTLQAVQVQSEWYTAILSSVKLSGSFNPDDFIFDPETGTVGYACFLRGTRIATPEGETAVEDLKAGDLVLSHDGRAVAVKWIGHRTLRVRAIPEAKRIEAMPIRIRKGALGKGLPRRELVVSPQHHMYLDGALVPAVLLVNGKTIVQDFSMDKIEYFHIELDRFDVILAEGTPTESYLDTGNRAMFDGESRVVTQLRPGFQEERRELTRQARADCGFEVLRNGPRLNKLRRRLFARAESLTGLPRKADSGLRLLCDGAEIRPDVSSEGRYSFTLETPPADGLLLVSRTSVLRDGVDNATRSLDVVGVGVTGIELRDGASVRDIPLDHAALTGFHPAHRHQGGQRRWTSPAAELPASLFAGLNGPVTVTLTIDSGSLRYWSKAAAKRVARAA